MNLNDAVVDASVVIKWFLAEEDSDLATALLRYSLQAPDFLLLECGNVFWVGARRTRLTAVDAGEFMAELVRIGVRFTGTADLASAALDLALLLDERIYDCIYLALAIRTSAVLVTADEKFVEKARSFVAYAPHVALLSDLRSTLTA